MRRLILLAATIALAACSPFVTSFDGSDSSSSRSASTTIATYTGVVKPAGISIYMEGTHRLELSDGRFVLLESDTTNLNSYIGQRVEVTGMARETTEAGGTIVKVTQISPYTQHAGSGSSLSSSSASGSGSMMSSSSDSSLASSSSSDSSSSSSSSVSTSSASSSSVSSVVSSSSSSKTSSSSSVVSSSSSSKTSSSVASSSSSSVVSSSSSVSSDPDSVMKDRTDRMAKADLSPAKWTQEYCSSGYGFCLPVQKNWWFMSFLGVNDVVRIEIGPDQIESMNSGPIVISLQSGTSASMQATDGDVRVQGATVYGYRDWTDNRHFVVSAPASLEAAVRYISEHIAAR